MMNRKVQAQDFQLLLLVGTTGLLPLRCWEQGSLRGDESLVLSYAHPMLCSPASFHSMFLLSW